MNVVRDMPIDEARRWLEMARGDLASGRAVRGMDEPVLRNVGFHAQQAAEKALKAVRAAHDMLVPKVHELAELVTDVPVLAERVDAEALDALSPWAVAGRYPADIPERLTPDEADHLLALAAEITDIAERLLDEPPS